MAFPLFSNSLVIASNTFECGRSLYKSEGALPKNAKAGATFAPIPLSSPVRTWLRDASITEFPDPLHRCFIGFERIVVTGNHSHQLLQECECGIDVLVAVKGHKTARK